MVNPMPGPAGTPESDARWYHTRGSLRLLGDELRRASLEEIPERVVALVVDATESEQATLFLRRGSRLVARASAGRTAAGSPLAAVAERALASAARTTEATPDGVAVVSPLVLAGTPEGALAVLQATTSPIPVEETAERLDLFAVVAAEAVRTEVTLARRRNAALEAVHRLVARTAHELNNPLGGVKLYGRLIEQRLAKAGDAYGEGIAQKVGHAVDRLSVLIGELAERGRSSGSPPERVSVNAVLTEVLASLQSRLATTAVEVTLELDDGVGAVMGDTQALRGALLHLLTNALEATPSGGRFTVKTLRPDAGTVEVVVEDNGPGMDVVTRERALELFFTTRPSSAGLGLAIVLAAVEAHGGHLDLRSELGRGTRVTVRLPAAAR
jgi:signal transduction histidine kinase